MILHRLAFLARWILHGLASWADRIALRFISFYLCAFVVVVMVAVGCGQEGISSNFHPQPDHGEVTFPSDLPPDATISAGTMSGVFSVPSTGEATYTLPIVVPPGRAGMQPTLALTYDSALGDASVGKGFFVSGLSSITRCPHTVAEDEFIGRVVFDKSDAMCLDGKRLVWVKDTPDAVEYRTLPDIFAKVLAYFPEGWDRTLGPEHFDVHTKAGVTLTYGGTPDSKALANTGAVRTWWISRSTDRNQNSVLYSYENDKDPTGTYTQEVVPASIRYTDHPSAPASRAVVFDYHDRPDAAVRRMFTHGMALTNSKLLAGIRTLGPGDALVRTVYLSYQSGGDTGTPLLASISECAADKVCKPPTTFGWNIKKPGFTRIITPITVPEAPNAAVMTCDMNGDGLDEVILSDTPFINGQAGPTRTWSVAMNTGPGSLKPSFFPAITQAAKGEEGSEGLSPERGTPMDYNHDGRMDIFVHDVDGLHENWQLLLAQPDHTFKRFDTGMGWRT